MSYKHILFDLDGTLTNPALGITNSIMYALRKLGEKVPPREELFSFIGPPLVDNFEAVFGFSKEKNYWQEYFPRLEQVPSSFLYLISRKYLINEILQCFRK